MSFGLSWSTSARVGDEDAVGSFASGSAVSRLDPLADKGLRTGFLPCYRLAQFISVVIPRTAHGTFWQWMDDHVG